MKITAAVTESKGAPFELQELELGELRPDEVLVEVAAAGICHTDLICRDQWYPVPLPAVLGHEGAGTVVATGAAVSGLAAGDRVGMTFDSCGHCPSCQRALSSYCHFFFERNFAAARGDGTSVLSREGGPVHGHFFGQSCFATHAVAGQRNVVKLDDALPLDVAAPFGCGIQTGAGAVLNVLRPASGSSIAIFGTGAVGLAATLAAALAGCTTIVGVDRNPARLELARELGATHTVEANGVDPVEAIGAIVPGGVEFSLETTAVPTVLRSAVDCLAPIGTCGMIGAAAIGTEVELDMNTVMNGGRVLRGIVEGEAVPALFQQRLADLWKAGKFPVERMMRFYDFEEIERAAADAESGRVVKPVLRMR